MYLDALSFLEDERDTFRAYEALLDLSDDQLDVPVEAANGWSGRDLMGHILVWQEAALASAKELAVNEQSPTQDRLNAEWDVPGAGDRMNQESLDRFRALPDRRGPGPVQGGLGRPPRLPDGRPGVPLDQALRPPELVLQRDHRALRGAPPRAPRDPRGGAVTGTGNGTGTGTSSRRSTMTSRIRR